MNDFKGYHAEWNLGCPGGWEYQRMAQERGRFAWSRIKAISGLEIELDFEHPLLNPVPAFVNTLLRAHRLRFQREQPFVLLVAEEETLDEVTENINLVACLNQMAGVKASLASPQEVERRGDLITFKGQKVTVTGISPTTSLTISW